MLAWQTAMLASRLPRSARVILCLGRTDIIRIQRKRVAQIKTAPTDMMRIHGVRVNARWLRDFMACDPSSATSAICSGPIPARWARAATAAPCASR